MSDDRPLRHTEYLAMAEENRRLVAELAELKPQKETEPPNESWWLKNGFAVVVVAVFVVLGGWLTGGIIHNVRDEREQAAQPVCYRIARESGEPPWAPLLLWEVRSGRNREWVKKAKYASFGSVSEADAFLHKYGLKGCAQ